MSELRLYEMNDVVHSDNFFSSLFNNEKSVALAIVDKFEHYGLPRKIAEDSTNVLFNLTKRALLRASKNLATTEADILLAIHSVAELGIPVTASIIAPTYYITVHDGFRISPTETAYAMLLKKAGLSIRITSITEMIDNEGGKGAVVNYIENGKEHSYTISRKMINAMRSKGNKAELWENPSFFKTKIRKAFYRDLLKNLGSYIPDDADIEPIEDYNEDATIKKDDILAKSLRISANTQEITKLLENEEVTKVENTNNITENLLLEEF